MAHRTAAAAAAVAMTVAATVATTFGDSWLCDSSQRYASKDRARCAVVVVVAHRPSSSSSSSSLSPSRSDDGASDGDAARRRLDAAVGVWNIQTRWRRLPRRRARRPGRGISPHRHRDVLPQRAIGGRGGARERVRKGGVFDVQDCSKRNDERRDDVPSD